MRGIWAQGRGRPVLRRSAAPSKRSDMTTTRLVRLALLLLLCAGSLLRAPNAWAQDACLTGSSTLADQRSLAALRASLESACPCASFTRRTAYQRCARGAIKAALDAGQLRPECEAQARLLRRGATCGSTKVACGRFSPGAESPLTCAVKPASRCSDRRRYEENVCTGQSYCADVVDWTATTCTDVRVRYPFEAGVRVLTFTKDSAASPGTPRVLNTVVWYPTSPGQTPINPSYGAVLDAPLDPAAAPYPILLFSHGSCGYATQSLFLTALLAAQGFVVVAPPHPGNTIFDFPNCGTPQALAAAFVERPQDMIFVLDQMLNENTNPLSPFYAAVDENRVGMSGHSFGGLTTYLVAAADARIKVAIPMAPAVPGSPVLAIPSLTMLGQIDSVVNNNNIRTAYTNALPPKYLVEIANAGHYAFSDFCFPSPDCNPPVTLTQAEAHDAVLRWVLPFLKRHLVGDVGFAPFFSAAPPGVAFLSEP